MAFMAATHFGALELDRKDVQRWSKPVLDAFLAGAWMLHFTDDTLFWVAKPEVHVETIPGGRRLHSETTAAVESAVERLYFWHGVIVPAFVVMRPDWITLDHIAKEENAETRRVMMERYGYERYLTDIGADREQADDFGELFRVKRGNDTDLVMVRVINSTAEPDGSFKKYMIRVPPHVETAHEAVAWTWGTTQKQYAPALET